MLELNFCVYEMQTNRIETQLMILLSVFSAPRKTRVAQRACISARGMIAPSPCIKPTTANDGLSRFGGKTCLYKDRR